MAHSVDSVVSPASTIARCWFAATALVVIVGLAIQVPVAMDNESGFFTTPLTRGLNVFVFFTVQSNILVAIGTALLALGTDTRSTVFQAVRLTGLVAITLTFVVFHAVLRDLQDLTGQAAVADLLLHTASPILCVSGWVVFGPRQLTSARIVWASLVFLVAWGAFTLIRGPIVDWYPYPFMDPNEHSYGRIAINLTIIAAVFVGLSAGAHKLDEFLARRQSD